LGLENRRSRKRLGSSNLLLSAIKPGVRLNKAQGAPVKGHDKVNAKLREGLVQ
jgi:hypothetical protein